MSQVKFSLGAKLFIAGLILVWVLCIAALGVLIHGY